MPETRDAHEVAPAPDVGQRERDYLDVQSGVDAEDLRRVCVTYPLMGILRPFLMVAAGLILISTALWGFPGIYALAAVVPAFIIGATIAHVRAPREEGGRLRPGVVVLGGMFGLAIGAFAVLMMWAATAPEHVVIGAERTVVASAEDVWRSAGDPTQRPRWHTWMVDMNEIGKAGKPTVGSQYWSMLQLEGQHVRANHTVTEYVQNRRFGWTIEPPEGTRLQDMAETITLSDAKDGVTVRYELSYRVPSVLGRVFDRLVVRRSIEKVAEASLQRLAELATE